MSRRDDGRGRDRDREAKPRKAAAREEPESWTRIGISWWSWRPLRGCSAAGRLLWLALYTSGTAKRCPPGLWQGGVALMAEAAELTVDEATAGLVELQRAGLVEYDEETRVARLVILPDQLERPANGHGIRKWWSAFKTIPRCAVRDRHVWTLAWLMGRPTDHHAEAWAEHFGPLARSLLENGSVNGSDNRSSNGSGNSLQHAENGQNGNGSGNGSLNPLEKEMEMVSSLEGERTRSHAHSSREIPSVEDPTVGQAASDAMAAWERRRAGAGQGADVVDLADRGLRRFGPRLVTQEGPAPSSERFR